jgi:hypothetical protein
VSFSVAKEAVRTVLKDVIAQSRPIAELRSTALFNPERDAVIRSSTSFDAAKLAVTDVPNFVGRFGTEAGERIVLQFVYQYFKRVLTVQYDGSQFEKLWCDFVAEVQDAYWIVRGVANVRNFDTKTYPIDLGDGVTIRGRSPSELASLGFDDTVSQRITEDWRVPGPSSFVLVAEHCFAKQPDNLILLDTYQLSLKAMRAIGALRLANTGSIGIGPMWVVRPARFDVGIGGGLTSTGISIPMYGSRYTWTEEVGRLYPSIYDALARLETEGYSKSPGNLAVALRSFMATYDRWPAFRDSQLLDLITSLEALLGTESEIAFKLSFRVASLVASNDQQSGELLKLIKGFYDTRSRIVHGGSLDKKHQERLQRIDELRSIVRRLLRSFVEFAVAPASGYDKAFWQEQLDATLVDGAQREKLREALGLVKP